MLSCKIFKKGESTGRQIFELVIKNTDESDSGEIKIQADFGKCMVTESYFRDSDLPKDRVYRVKPNAPTFCAVIGNLPVNATSCFQIIAECDDFRYINISANQFDKKLMKEDLE